MKTLPYFLALFPAFLLTALIGFTQEAGNSKIVSLHLSDNTELVHFQEGDYILTFNRADLLESFVGDEWLAQCTALLTIGDTLDFETVDEQLLKLPDGFPNSLEFNEAVDRHLKSGNVRIHSIATGKNLARVRYSETLNCRYQWVLEDLSNNTPIYSIRHFRVISTPAF